METKGANFSAPDAHQIVEEAKRNVNKDELASKIALWSKSGQEDKEFTDDEIIFILSEPNSFSVPMLSNPPQNPESE